MKFSIYILSIILFGLVAFSGIENARVGNVTQNETLSFTSGSNIPQELDHNSILFTCNCSATPFLDLKLNVQNNYFFIFEITSLSATSALKTSYFSAIWQPPKAS